MSMSKRTEIVLSSLEKAYSGEICHTKDWDVKVIPGAVKAALERHGLKKTFDPAYPCNTDMELADTYYKAAYELALELGFLCEDTERIIKVTEKELNLALQTQPKQLVLGAGADQVFMKSRKPGDDVEPMVMAPLTLGISEENYVPALAGFAKYRNLVDILSGLTMDQAKGMAIRAGTPYETWLGHYEQELKRQALWMVGREDMATCTVANSATAYGYLGGAASTPGHTPTSLCLLPSEMKIDFANFHRAITGINLGHYIHSGSLSYIGGYAGPVEGALVLNIANELLQHAILGSDYTGNHVYDLNNLCGTTRKALWANSIGTQAIARNTELMSFKVLDTVGGVCTDFYLYESAVGMMIHAASGASGTCVPRSSAGKYPDYITPVEAWWSSQIFKSCGSMNLDQVNDIANQLIPKYEDGIKSPPKGKPIQEVFDLERLEPSQEYRSLFEHIRLELIQKGMPIKEKFNF